MWKRIVPVALLAGLAGLAGCRSPDRPHIPSQVGQPPAPQATSTGGFADSINRVQMLDADTAWAVGPGVAYRTMDGGAHWTELRYHSENSKASLVAAVALDAGHFWTVERNSDRSSLVVWSTASGGDSWTSTAVDPGRCGLSRVDLDFVTLTDGWMLVSGGPATGLMSKALYHSVDGGRTWDTVASGCPGDQTTSGSWLTGGMYTTGMAFQDSVSGWVTGSYHGADSIPIYHTGDGGKSWVLQQLTLPHNYSHAYYGNGLRPLFFGQNRQTGVLPVGLRIGDTYQILLFTSADGGRTWGAAAAAEAPQCASGSAQECELMGVDPGHLWLFAKSGSLYRTQDAGQSWQQVAAGWNLIDVSFGAPDTGLGLARTGQHQVLVISKDGGATWSPAR